MKPSHQLRQVTFLLDARLAKFLEQALGPKATLGAFAETAVRRYGAQVFGTRANALADAPWGEP